MPKSRKRKKKSHRRPREPLAVDIPAVLMRNCPDDALPLYMLLYGWNQVGPHQADEVYRSLLFIQALRQVGLVSELWCVNRTLGPLPEGLMLDHSGMVELKPEEVEQAFGRKEEQGPHVVVFVPQIARLIDLSPPNSGPLGGLPLVLHADVRGMDVIAAARPPNMVTYDFMPEVGDRQIPLSDDMKSWAHVQETVLLALSIACRVPGILTRAKKIPNEDFHRVLELAEARTTRVTRRTLEELSEQSDPSGDVAVLFLNNDPGQPPGIIMEHIDSYFLPALFESWCAAMGLELVRRLPGELSLLRGWTVDLDEGLVISNHLGAIVLQVGSVPDDWKDGLLREGACAFIAGMYLQILTRDPADRPRVFSEAATWGWLAGGLAATAAGRPATLQEFYPVTIRPEDFSS